MMLIPLEWAAHAPTHLQEERLFLSTGKGVEARKWISAGFLCYFLGYLVLFTQPWHPLTSHQQCEPHVASVSEATCPKSHGQNLPSEVIPHVLPSQPDNISSSTLFPAVQWASIPLFLYPVPWPRLQHKLQVPSANKFNTSSFGNGWGNYLPAAFAGI